MKTYKSLSTLLMLAPMVISNAFALAPMDSQIETISRSYDNQLSHLNLRHQKTNTKGTILEKVQTIYSTPENWFNLDLQQDDYVGVSTNKVYQEFGEPTASEDIIVAVIDSGVDVNHEDLQGKIWINEDEIPDNGIDDDNNGYVDDVFGWNFIGAKDGNATIVTDNSINGLKMIQGDQSKQVSADSLEVTREYTRLIKLKKDLEAQGLSLTKVDTKKLIIVEQIVKSKRTSALDSYNYYVDKMKVYKASENVLINEGGLTEITYEKVEALTPSTQTLALAQKNMLELLDKGLSIDKISGELEYYDSVANFHYNPNSDTRKDIVKDDYLNPYDNNYGNNDVIGPDAFHGTHVAGIIAADRENNIGIQGVAKKVKIMALRAVPNGDERDKDVANAIIYAVNNGAKVINMSFGKDYSPYKKAVNAAVKLAQDNGVLLVHAAGNSYQDNDKSSNFPNRTLHGKEAKNWIEVGASSYKADSALPAGFSNYGKKSVDIFAPGVNINSTIPNNKYSPASGTSMATPVVSGIAALVLSYVPNLTCEELKSIIINTTNRFPKLYVYKARVGKVLFSELSIYGGVPNAYEAVKSAVENKSLNVKIPFKIAGQ